MWKNWRASTQLKELNTEEGLCAKVFIRVRWEVFSLEIPKNEGLCRSLPSHPRRSLGDRSFAFFLFYCSFGISKGSKRQTVKQDPRGEAPVCLFSSMRINGGYKTLIADVFEESQSGCLGRIILMRRKRIGNSSTPWISVLLDLSPAYRKPQRFLVPFSGDFGHKIASRHWDPSFEILNDPWREST